VPTIRSRFPVSESWLANNRCHDMKNPAEPRPRRPPPTVTRIKDNASQYMAIMRQTHPRRYGTLAVTTRNLRVGLGKKYTPTVLAKYVKKKTSDCAKKKLRMISEVWNSRGRNGNTPPQTPAALMAKNKA